MPLPRQSFDEEPGIRAAAGALFEIEWERESKVYCSKGKAATKMNFKTIYKTMKSPKTWVALLLLFPIMAFGREASLQTKDQFRNRPHCVREVRS